MSTKDILERFNKQKKETTDKMNEEEKKISAEIEGLLIKLNRCFVDVILPGIFEVENDLNEAGYWNQVNIGQSTSLESGKPNIKEVTCYFFPEKTRDLPYDQKNLDIAYQARIIASGGLRQITFSIQFPQRLSKVVETDDISLPIENINKKTVDDFLEKFVKGAIDSYMSDRVLR